MKQGTQLEESGIARKDAVSAPNNSARTSSGVLLFKSLLRPQVRTILVRGEPGTGKTTLAIDLLSQYGKGMYVSTRVSEQQLSLQNPTVEKLLKEGLVKEISIQKDFDLATFNFADFRLAAVEDVLQAILSSSSGTPDEPMIVLDSWDTIAKKLDPVEKMRTEQSLLVIAEANHARLLFVSEEIGLTSTDYIVDAVVQLEDTIFEGRRLRQIIWKKLRGSSIPQRSYLYSLHGGKFNVLEDSFVPWPEPFVANSLRARPDGPFYYSSGSKALDSFLGGGFRRGSLVLLELGKHLGDYWHVPIVRSVEMNFLANDGCAVVIPVGNFPPEMIKTEFLRFFEEKVLRGGLRIVHSNSRETDPCFLKISSRSVRSRADLLTANIRAMKGKQNRPCCYFVGSDMIEGLLGDEVSKHSIGPTLAQGMKYTGDLTLLAVREGSSMMNEMMSACDMHLKLDDVDNTLLLYSIKPRSELYHVRYDYSKGSPEIGLVPVV